MKNIYQMRIHSRGGQGAKTAAQILAEAAISGGKFAQAFSEYGPERSGAPMKTFFRISDQPIRLHCDIKSPDLILVVDPSLLDTIDVTEGLIDGGVVIVNCGYSSTEIKKKLKNKNCEVYNLDGTKIAMELFGKDIPNMPMIGAVIKITKLISCEQLIKSVRKKFSRKLGETLTEKNVEALKRGYEEIGN
ncbi:MAG: 2-oxoacid:acceptor oxidoreductase family protein [Patescibacteria group bacterium]|nr:2-oxoacid:acceptor oxidoreductase family protein [Patescibacteria group bacterium]